MEKYICIHGHFYQPPRENPWLEFVEPQDSAYPYHNWNERITAECYGPNSTSRILDTEGRIQYMVDNYATMSFNFGPTLLAWMELNAADTYKAVLEADRKSQQNFSGHGSALAQPYNHMIMPLASRRDKYTQALWGLRDFERRFGRQPGGMWLPETAVDLETLDIMAELGIKFTILAPHQASRVRALGSRQWQDVSGGGIDPTMAYSVDLPSGRKMALFFYDDPISRAVAFEGILRNGEPFANRLLGAFSEKRDWPQLVHIATDGETYGHHHRFGDMALAYAFHHIRSNNLARITNYGEYLEKHPPTHQVEIVENTSWSCAHGVERWRDNCGCNSGAHPGWSQAWRKPLREALDWLRDTVAPKYEERAAQLLKDPWAARNDYLEVMLDRSLPAQQQFLDKHAVRPLDDGERVIALKLMELQRHAMFMFTSCGWFFDDLSGIETVQVIQYAGRAVQLAEELFDGAIEPSFLELLAAARGNVPQYGDGRQVYEKAVKPAMLDLTKVVAHYAISSLFEDYGQSTKVYSYLVDREHYQAVGAGRAKLAVGRARVTSEVTRESAVLTFGVLHFGDHNLNAGVRDYQGEEAYGTMVQEVNQAFSAADLPAVIRLLDKNFGSSTYSLRSLFRDEQRRVLGRILGATLSAVEAEYRQVYERSYPLMLFLHDLGNPLPRAFSAAAEFILNFDLERALSGAPLDMERIRGLLDAATLWAVDLDSEGLSYALGLTLEKIAGSFVANQGDLSLLKKLLAAVETARAMPFEVNLWRAQNACYAVLKGMYPGMQERVGQGDAEAVEWVENFRSVAEGLYIRVA